jgi:hypothetical protein
VYESFPLLATKVLWINIPAQFSFTKLRVEIKNAILNNLSVNISDENISKAQQQVSLWRLRFFAYCNSSLLHYFPKSAIFAPQAAGLGQILLWLQFLAHNS